MNCKGFLILTFLVLTLTTSVVGQNRRPLSFDEPRLRGKEVPLKMLPPIPSARSGMTKAAKSSFLKSLEVGTSLSVQYRLKADGRVDTVGKSTISRIRVKSVGAQSLGVRLTVSGVRSFDGSTVFIYTPDSSFVASSLAKVGNNEPMFLPVIPGDEAIVEVVEPIGSKSEIVVADIIHSEKQLTASTGSAKALSQSCNVDINCPLGADWQYEKSSVVKIAISTSAGVRLCTGTLVNNTSRDKTPYIFTANHCITNATDAKNSIFYFNYENKTCGQNDALQGNSISGSTLVATGYNSNLDFSLVRLSVPVPDNFNPYYAGWDIRKNPIPTPLGVGIHHPNGDVKKISVAYSKPVVADYVGELQDPSVHFDKNTHWRINKWDVGTTEGGSSGSALFNSNHQVIGSLTGGMATCSNSINDYYSMISAAWSNYSETQYQLKKWLDPAATGDSTCSGMTQKALPFNLNVSSYNPCVGDTISVTVNPPTANLTIRDFGANNLNEISGNGTYKLVWKTSGNKIGNAYINNSLVGEVYFASVRENPEKPAIERLQNTLSTNSPYIVQWYLNGAVYPSESGNTILISNPGIYSAKVTNNYGCSTTSDPITVRFSENIDADSLTIYPVPVNRGVVNLKMSSFITGTLTISLFNTAGQLLGSEAFSNPADIFEYRLPATARNGIYLLEIKTKNSRALRKIVVVGN